MDKIKKRTANPFLKFSLAPDDMNLTFVHVYLLLRVGGLFLEPQFAPWGLWLKEENAKEVSQSLKDKFELEF